jgi:hypothetical protein
MGSRLPRGSLAIPCINARRRTVFLFLQRHISQNLGFLRHQTNPRGKRSVSNSLAGASTGTDAVVKQINAQFTHQIII